MAVKKAPTKKAPAKKATTKAAAPAAGKKAPAKKAAAKQPAAKAAAPKKTVTKTTGKTAGDNVQPLNTRKSKSDLSSFTDFKPYTPAKGERYMSEKQVAHFRQILLAWKRALMEEVDRTVHHMQDEAANFPDPNDRATQESEFSMELRTRDRERKLIKKIDESLNNLDTGEYGYCESCGVEIGIRRLEARPTAGQCIDCKTLDEIREKQMGT
jgi:DnaK suppressor protein